MLFLVLPSHNNKKSNTPAPLGPTPRVPSTRMDHAYSPSKSSHWNAKPSEYDYSYISHLCTSTLPNCFQLGPYSDAMSSRDGVGNPFPTLATTSRFQSHNLRLSRSTFASSLGPTSPSRKYITWLTKGSSSLMARLQTVGCRVTISTSLCNVVSIFVTDTLNLQSPVPFHPPIRSPHLINQVRAIIQIQ
jgi:hypothetical protein